MFLSWVVMLHIPRIIGNAGFEPQWTSGLIALGFGGVALLVAGEPQPLPEAFRTKLTARPAVPASRAPLTNSSCEPHI